MLQVFPTHSQLTHINYSGNISNTIMYYKIVLYQCQSCVTILYIITVITEIKIRISNINYDNHSLINVYTGGIIMPNDFIVRPKCTDKKEDRSITMTICLERELQEQYDDLSAKSGRSRNELMCMALRYALDNLKFVE